TTIEVVADKGYHKVELLHELRRAEYRTYIPVPDQKGQRRFTDKGGMLAREAFHQNRARVRLRGRDNVRKRYIAHIAALNLGLVMRTLFGHGTPRQAADAALAGLLAG